MPRPHTFRRAENRMAPTPTNVFYRYLCFQL